MELNFYGQNISTGGVSEKPLDQILYERYFINYGYGFFIECGANDGNFISTCKSFEERGWRGINIEPSQTLYNNLISNRSKSYLNLNLALSDKDEEVSFEEVSFDNGGFSRLEIAKQPTTDAQFNLTVAHQYWIPAITYKTLVSKYKIDSVDLMVLDVENNELRVLDGMVGALVLPKFLCIEHSHVGLTNVINKIPQYTLDWHDSMNGVFILCN
jgi:FkbM family methyltransferase